MRIKLLAVASVLASLSAAAPSLADDTKAGSVPVDGASTLPSGPGSATVAAPTPPVTPQSSAVVAPTGAASTTLPASTTTTTSGDTSSAALPMSTNRDTTTLYERRRPNRPLLITGGLILAGTYATTAALAANEGSIRDHDLYIPIAGPWINLASRDSSGDNNTRDTVLIAGSGILQAVGAGMFITSFFVPEKIPTATIQAGPVKMRFTPTAGAGAGGVGAFGTF